MDTSAIITLVAALFAGGIGVGSLLPSKRSPAGWLFAGGMLALALESICGTLMLDASYAQDLIRWHERKLVFTSLLPGIWLAFSLSYARGNARESLKTWRWPLLAIFLLPPCLVFAFRRTLLFSVLPTAVPLHWGLELGQTATATHLLLLLSSIFILTNLERTYRASVGTMRWRIKFMILGVGTLFAVRLYVCTQVLLFHSTSLSLQAINSAGLLLACGLITRSLLRTGHFEVSLYPSPAVLQNSLTMLLAGIYLLAVGAFAKLVVLLGGDSAFQIKTFVILVALAGLGVLLLSDHARLHMKRFVSRHFQRPLHDYRSVWRSFTAATIHCVEPAELGERVVKLLSEVFEALSVTLWRVDDAGQNLAFGASTSLSHAKARQISLCPSDAARIIQALSTRAEPFDLDECRELWASPLRRMHPEDFRRSSNRVCVPLLAGGEVLGFLILGDRVADIPFSQQDLDLLKSVGDQVAANLLNLRLSQRISQSKQLEAFQAMSAFFVHDLKNTAATLSLMLKNLPAHFQQEQFREDALRGISKTVTHINEMIERLGILRHDSAIHPETSDLNELITDALGREPTPANVEVVTHLGPVPRIFVDGPQIQKVVTNLVLNARDSLGNGGKIEVETSQTNGWVVLSVSDNGCGMTPEFLEDSLFRPFRTTKKHGVGIGMFHCKTLIEAHRGRIDVTSELGKGTAIRVFLPITTPDGSSS